MHTAEMLALTAVASVRKHAVGHLLLVRRKRRIQRFRRSDHFAQPSRALCRALLRTLEPLDRSDLGPFRPACTWHTLTLSTPCAVELCAALLNALIHRARMLAQDVREIFPLRLLRLGDLQRRPRIGETRFDAFARHRKAAGRSVTLGARAVRCALLSCLCDDYAGIVNSVAGFRKGQRGDCEGGRYGGCQ